MLFLLSCCGYTTRAMLPAYIKTIYIQPVDNQTLRPQLGERLGDELASSFTRSGRLRVTSDASADLSLHIRITGYRRVAAVFDAQRNVSEWSYEISFAGECLDQTRNTVLWEQSQAVREVVEASINEEDGISRAILRAAEEIVRNTLLAW